jgi:hypothetical protein
LLAATPALAGPPAPCGYYPNSLIPRQCGNFYHQPDRLPVARCRDGTADNHDANACATHGGVMAWE